MKNRRRNPRIGPIVDGYDHVEVASIDSFPASDPPGWIESSAHPCVDDVAETAENCSKRANKGADSANAR